jgi:hypothetical protein
MRHKLIALTLVLTAVSWAQNTTQTTPSTPQQSSAPADVKACPCCDKMADMKDGHACCAHHANSSSSADAKEASCCGSKDAKSCNRTAGDKTAAACCSGEKCGKDCGKSCSSPKKGEKTAKSCCAGQCAGHMTEHSSAGAGN